MYRHRLLIGPLAEALADTPVVVVAGPRQAGKSTLAEHVVTDAKGTWLTLDDAAVLDAARADPVGFVSGRTGLVGVDEAQRVPDLLLAVKAEVDRERGPGRFLLTGSTRLLGAPKLADSLAGRMEALTLWPFTQAELGDAAAAPGLIDRAFGDDLSGLRPSAVTRAGVLDRAAAGGFLPALARTDRRRTAWYDSYVSGVIDREVRAVTDATYLRELPRLLRLCAARTSGELNITDLARDLGLSRPTTDSYLAHLEAVFLIQTIPAWSTNLTARVVRRPKLVIRHRTRCAAARRPAPDRRRTRRPSDRDFRRGRAASAIRVVTGPAGAVPLPRPGWGRGGPRAGVRRWSGGRGRGQSGRHRACR